MSKRRSIFTLVWLALWTLGAFVAITQLWLLPESPPLAKLVLFGGLALFCGLAWLATLWSLLKPTKSQND